VICLPGVQATGPPKPNPRFSRADLKRIKQQGPSIDDLMVGMVDFTPVAAFHN
jgi:hypothetical protein